MEGRAGGTFGKGLPVDVRAEVPLSLRLLQPQPALYLLQLLDDFGDGGPQLGVHLESKGNREPETQSDESRG